MITNDSEYFKIGNKLRDICRKTAEQNFDSLSKKELKKMLFDARTLLPKCRSEENNEAFNLLEFRVKSNIDSMKNKNRFIVQLVLSIVILIVTLLSVFVEFPIGASSNETKQQQTQRSK